MTTEELCISQLESAKVAYESREIDNGSLDLYYIAGLFDGEGHIGINKSRNGNHTRYILRIQIGSTDLEVLDILKRYKNKITTSDSSRWNKNASTAYKWEMHCKAAVEFLLKIEPFLKIKRKKMAIKLAFILEFLRKKPGGNVVDITRLPKQEAIYMAILKLNSGKEIKESNSQIFKVCNDYIKNMIVEDFKLLERK